MKLKLTKETETAKLTGERLNIGSSYGFWDDLTSGGYFKPEHVLTDKKQLSEVHKAIKLLMQLEEIYNEVASEF